MGFEISWLVPNRVINANIVGDITIEDLQNGSALAMQMFEESDAPLVHVITNEGQIGTMPISIKMFSEAVEFMRHPQMGWMIMYPANDKVSKFVSGMVAGITRVRYRRFATIEESLEFLTSVDSTLPTVEEMLNQ